MGDTVVCGYYGPPEQGEEGNEAFGRQLKEDSESQAWLSWGTDICWKDNTVQELPEER